MSAPLSSIGATFKRAPRSSHSSCHGTMLEWCSIAVISTSSPGCTRQRPNDWATRLMPSVELRVKMISRVDEALKKRRTLPRAASCASVAISLSRWTPRWTLALLVT